MPVHMFQGATNVVCNNPANRGCQATLGTMLTDQAAIASLEAEGWSVDTDRGIAICPACSRIAPGGIGELARYSNEDLLSAYFAAILEGFRPYRSEGQAAVNSAVREILRRLNYAPHVNATDIQLV